ncbi:hypothetical protein Tco_1490354 [Tanacetum coccineum]
MDQDSAHIGKVIDNGQTLQKTVVVEDAKLLLEAVEKRFGENAATKKTQRNLLKQQYENFTAPKIKRCYQTLDRLSTFFPPPYTGNFIPPAPDLSFIGLDEFVNKHVVDNIKSDEEVSKVVRKSDDSLIIKD